MTVHAFRIFSFSFLFSAIPVYSSAFFTALNNGALSALISFARIFIFEIGSVLLLPMVMGLDGIWLSMVVAELAASEEKDAVFSSLVHPFIWNQLH